MSMTTVYSQNNKDKKSTPYIYNKKGQLLADTSLIADSSIAYIYKSDYRINELNFYSDFLNLIIYTDFFLERGIQGKLIFKFNMIKDSLNEYYSIIDSITIVGHPQIDIDFQRMFLNMNKEFLLNRNIYTINSINEYFVHVPIDYRAILQEDNKDYPFVHKYIENGYLVIEASAYNLVSYDNE